ncbi:MAG: hypothetical protein H6937_09210 [Burkholderiales bacterium]|nr:hypothetical protein [Burkholderiales bacterium]
MTRKAKHHTLSGVTASSDRTARLWDAQTGKVLGNPIQHDGTVDSATFSPDGTWVVTASNDNWLQN